MKPATETAKKTVAKKPPAPAKIAAPKAQSTMLAKAKESSVATDLAAWGPAPKLSSKDVVIPRILCMQAMSKPVVNGEAKFGEFRDSFGKLLGDEANPLEFIPFHHEHVFVVMREDKGQFKFHKIVPVTPENDDQEFIVEIDGADEKWYRTTNVYCLLPGEVAEGNSLPYLLSFRSSSSRAGREVYTQMYVMNRKDGIVPPGRTLTLLSEKTKNDKGTFSIMKVKVTRDSTPEEVGACLNWFKTIQSGKTRIDTSDIEAEVGETSGSAQSEAPDSGDY